MDTKTNPPNMSNLPSRNSPNFQLTRPFFEVSGLVVVWNFFQPTNDRMTNWLKISHNPPSPTHAQSKDFV